MLVNEFEELTEEHKIKYLESLIPSFQEDFKNQIQQAGGKFYNVLQTIDIEDLQIKLDSIQYAIENLRLQGKEKISIEDLKKELNNNYNFIEINEPTTNYIPLRQTNLSIPMSKVARKATEIFSYNVQGVFPPVKVSQTKKQKTEISAHFEFNSDIYMTRKLDHNDIAVHNAVCSLFLTLEKEKRKQEDFHFTLQDVYRAMTGTYETNIADGVLKDIESRINFCRTTLINIDITNQVENWKIDTDIRIINDNLLPLSYIKKIKMPNGELTGGYFFTKKPPLVLYSQISNNQIVSMPLDCIDTLNPRKAKYKLSNTNEVVRIKQYLVMRIGQMTNDKKKPRKIIYNTLFEETGIDITVLTRTQIKRIRESVKKILEKFKDEKAIKGYEEYSHEKHKQKIVGVTIKL